MLDVRRRLLSSSLVSLLACANPSHENSSEDAPPEPPPSRSADGVVVRAGTSSLPEGGVEHLFVDVEHVALEYVGADVPRRIGSKLTLDLMDLVNGRVDTLGIATRVRPVESVHIEVSCAEIHFADGTIIERRFPHHGPAHLELSAARAMDTGDVLVQFDADHSLFRVDDAADDPDRVLVHLAARVFDGNRLSTIGGTVLDDAGTPDHFADDRPLANTTIVLEQGGLVVARSHTEGNGTYAFIGPYTGDFDVVCLPTAQTPDARAVHAQGPSVLGDEDFLFQVAESEGW